VSKEDFDGWQLLDRKRSHTDIGQFFAVLLSPCMLYLECSSQKTGVISFGALVNDFLL